MPNMTPNKHPIPTQPADVRRHNFDEVALGYTKEDAIDEAKRCLNCKNSPCIAGCPVSIDIPGFLKKTAESDIDGAADILGLQTSLPAVCGRVCPQESQCEAKCVRGIKHEPVAIGRIERFVADEMRRKNRMQIKKAPANGHKVAIVGAGPAGLTAAGDLAKMGYSITVYEALHKCGGVLVYGIPQFRLPKDIVQYEIDALKNIGVSFETDVVIGRTLTVDDLFNAGYEAIFIGSGAGLPSFMNIPGENLNRVYSANEYLTRINLMGAWQPGSDTPIIKAKNVTVVGGGNVAMDAARCAVRLGAEKVSIVYRRSMAELPARAEEVEHAKEEGVEFLTLTTPKEILGDEHGIVTGMHCVKCELGEPDASGRRRPIEIPGSDFVLKTDCVIMAIGTSPNPLIRSTTPGLTANSRGCIVTQNPAGKTAREGVWAGGDAVTGAATVILAMGAGKSAAKEIDEYIRGKS